MYVKLSFCSTVKYNNTLLWSSSILYFLSSQALTKDLQSIRVEAKETQADKIHAENVKKGVDKFKTLKQIRQGNTKTRVELFENM